MKIDLSYANKEGISLQNVLDVLNVGEAKGKKEIQDALNTTKSIDTLLGKLEDASLISKDKVGNKIMFSAVAISTEKVEEAVVEEKPKKTTKKAPAKKPAAKTTKKVKATEPEPMEEEVVAPKVEEPAPTPKKVTKAKPKNERTPAEVKEINELTQKVSEKHQIKSLVEIEEEKKGKTTEKEARSVEVNEDDLETLRQELESRTGKEVTAILHKRNDKAIKNRKQTAQELYDEEQKKLSEAGETYDEENPYRFVLNFFTSTLNGERATPYFRRRDEYVVKSIYNKFKTLCDKVEEYDISAQNLPFYRVITINMNEKVVKMYHIDMNRIVRGVHTIFKLNQFDDMFIKFK